MTGQGGGSMFIRQVGIVTQTHEAYVSIAYRLRGYRGRR